MFAVAVAAVSAVAVYALGHYGLGVDIETDPDRSRVTVAGVLAVSAMAAALAWSLLAALRWWTRRGRRLWTQIAVAVTIASLTAPLTTPDFTPEGRVLLSLLHLVVGGVVIATLRHASREIDDRV